MIDEQTLIIHMFPVSLKNSLGFANWNQHLLQIEALIQMFPIMFSGLKMDHSRDPEY